MQLNPSATELITALTNVPLALTAAFAAKQVWRANAEKTLAVRYWTTAFACLAVASGLGIFAHGLAWSPAALKFIWRPINAALALTVAYFAAGATVDGWGPAIARRVLPGLLVAGAAFYLYATWFAKTFLPFVVYEGVAMLFCLAVYLALTVSGRRGAPWMLAGVACTIFAAALQATRVVTFAPAWPVDHNSVFHLAQLPGLFCLLAGLKSGMAARERALSGLRQAQNS